METYEINRIMMRHCQRGIRLFRTFRLTFMGLAALALIYPGYRQWCLPCLLLSIGFSIVEQQSIVRHALTIRVLNDPASVFWAYRTDNDERVPSFPAKYLPRFSSAVFHLKTGELLTIEIPQMVLEDVLVWFRSQNPSAFLFDPTQISAPRQGH